MTCSLRPGKQLEPGQSAAEVAAAHARVAAPVLLNDATSQLDPTECAYGPAGSRGDSTPTGEPEDAAAPSRTSDAAVANRDTCPSKKLARPLLSPSHSGHHAPDDNPYMPLATLSRYSGLSVRTLRTALRDPLHPLPHYRLNAGGKVLVRRSEFDAWMSHCRVDSADVDAIVSEVLGDIT